MIFQRNPFYVGGAVPPEYFVGRQPEINSAFDAIYKHEHLAIYGSHGMGKSSLLRFLAWPKTWQAYGCNSADAFIVFLNCAEIQPFTSAGFWKKVLRLLKEPVVGSEALQTEIDQLLNKDILGIDDLRGVLSLIGQQNKFLVLLIDEYDTALYVNDSYTMANMQSFLSDFRNLATHGEESRYLSTIVVSLKSLINPDLGPTLLPNASPWHNHYKFRYLKPFTEKDVTLLLSRLPAQWMPDLLAGVQEICGRHPALLQNACTLLYETWRDRITQSVAEFATEFESATRQFFQGIWNESSEDEKSLLRLIALSRLDGRLNQRRKYKLDGVDTILSQRQGELRVLEERGILLRKTITITKESSVFRRNALPEEKEVYIFFSSIMEWWVVKEIERNPNLPDLSTREKVFLNLSSLQVEQMRAILKQVWQYKDTAQSIAGWVGGLSGAFVKGFAGSGTP